MPFRPLNRRTFLRASGVAIGLPMLDAMLPLTRAEVKALEAPRRMVLVSRPLGMYAPNFFPEQTGRDYEPSRYLKALEPHKAQFSVISGMSHHYASGHYASVGLFTGVHPDHIRPTDIRNSISLDQEVASHVGGQTRFACLIRRRGSPQTEAIAKLGAMPHTYPCFICVSSVATLLRLVAIPTLVKRG